VCVCACLCVCVSQSQSVCEHICRTTRVIFTKLFVHVAYMTVALGPPPARWRNLKGKGQFWGFLPHWQCMVWAVWQYEFRYKRQISLKFTSLQ